MSQKESEWNDEELMRGAIIRHTDFFLHVKPTDEFVDVLLGDIKTLMSHRLSNREKEIAEEVEKMKPIQQMINGEMEDTGFVEKEAVLKILKH